MKVEKHPELRAYRIQQLRNRILTPREGIHASDLDSCPNKVYYRRMCPDVEVPERSLLYFMSGICAEAWLAPMEIISKEKDGIIASPDDNTRWGYGEIKSTRSRQDYFKPATSYPHWIFRIKTYCCIFETNTWNLEVYFWVGDRGKNPIGYDTWKFTFTPIELKKHWKELLERKGVLEAALKMKVAPSDMIDLKHKRWNGWLEEWQCKSCEFWGICAYHAPSSELDK